MILTLKLIYLLGHLLLYIEQYDTQTLFGASNAPWSQSALNVHHYFYLLYTQSKILVL